MIDEQQGVHAERSLGSKEGIPLEENTTASTKDDVGIEILSDKMSAATNDPKAKNESKQGGRIHSKITRLVSKRFARIAKNPQNPVHIPTKTTDGNRDTLEVANSAELLHTASSDLQFEEAKNTVLPSHNTSSEIPVPPTANVCVDEVQEEAFTGGNEVPTSTKPKAPLQVTTTDIPVSCLHDTLASWTATFVDWITPRADDEAGLVRDANIAQFDSTAGEANQTHAASELTSPKATDCFEEAQVAVKRAQMAVMCENDLPTPLEETASLEATASLQETKPKPPESQTTKGASEDPLQSWQGMEQVSSPMGRRKKIQLLLQVTSPRKMFYHQRLVLKTCSEQAKQRNRPRVLT
jgi:hypothetical protein